MDESRIDEYLDMTSEELRAVLGEENPPLGALQASAILDFMQAYHLTDRTDAIAQYVKLRQAQAKQLGLSGEERARFLEGLPGEDE